jgi:hypothetical protein
VCRIRTLPSKSHNGEHFWLTGGALNFGRPLCRRRTPRRQAKNALHFGKPDKIDLNRRQIAKLIDDSEIDADEVVGKTVRVAIGVEHAWALSCSG